MPAGKETNQCRSREIKRSDRPRLVRGCFLCENAKNFSRAYQQNDLHGYTLSYSVLQAAAKTLRTVFLVARRQNSAVSLFEIR